jgi:hypothetical protein
LKPQTRNAKLLVVLNPGAFEQFLIAFVQGPLPSVLVQHVPIWLLREQYILSVALTQPLQSSASHVHRSRPPLCYSYS